jgi:hypothetical protein
MACGPPATSDGRRILSHRSEVGTVEFDDARRVEKVRLAPVEMIAIDTVRGILLRDDEIKAELAGAQAVWLSG